MNLKVIFALIINIILLLAIWSLPFEAETRKSVSSLEAEVLHRDQLLFDAFNSGNLDRFRSLLSENLEFYHDKDGVTNFAQTLEGASRLFLRNNGLHRTLDISTSEVYPLKNYGAIQTGQHTFCHHADGSEDCGTFKFLHIWKRVDRQLILERVVSYGH